MADSSSDISKGIERLARLGYAAKGTLYLVIGSYTVMAVLGIGGEAAGVQDAILKIARQPFGWFLLVMLGVGLVGHVLWRMVQAFADPERKGRGIKGTFRRLGMFLSGLIYLTTAYFTVELILNAGGGGETSPEQRSATLMSFTGGVYLLAAIGIGFIGVGVYQMRRAYRESFRKHWKTYTMSNLQIRLASLAGRIGLPARAVVFMIIGMFLIVAAWTSDLDEVRGMEGALLTLAGQPFGRWLLGAVSLGMVCYGCYCFCNAWFRKINPDNA
jgi:hypothetical protein